VIDQETLASIENLHRMKADGIITETEFEQAKQKLLFGPAQVRPAATTAAAAPATGQPVPTPAQADQFGWIVLPLKRYGDFSGRSSRREFWMFQLVYLALGVVFMFALVDSSGPFGTSSDLAKGLIVLCVCALLVLVVPLIAVQVRRFHDQDRSGLLVLLNLVPYVGALVVYVMMALPGTTGDNRFGSDPLG
jgi:uncharacterized membrane protein YhaH (DUF805 family)